jgi:hypothetical protein
LQFVQLLNAEVAARDARLVGDDKHVKSEIVEELH